MLLFAYAVVRVVKVCISVKRSIGLEDSSGEKQADIFPAVGVLFLSASGSVILSGLLAV